LPNHAFIRQHHSVTDAAFLDEHADGGRRLALNGRWTVAHIGTVEPLLRGLTPGGKLTLDLSGVERIDTIGAWLVHRLVRDTPGATIVGASDDAKRLIEQVGAADPDVKIHPDTGPRLTHRLETIGRGVVGAVDTLGNFLAFLGKTLVTLFQTLFYRRSFRWNSIVHQMDVVGVHALGIVGLLSFLVGIVLAQQGAVQLRQFGAEVFVVNLIGRSTVRELGILLTAIMVAGRSGSAFAAQIGSMKLNEEIDAMRTIGLSAFEVLVLPRVIATALMMVLLGFYGSLMAIIGGGLFCWLSLDMPVVTFVQRLQEVVPIADFWIGLFKAPIFGAIIAVTGCFQGMQVSGNAESVGQRTTAAVVQSIFLVIVLDAFFAVFFTALGYV
jgi:phospholipid/cholesterol/gamma-HCH transport system permease protein